MSGITQTTCPLADTTCLCADSKFNNVVTACITADCTIKETLSMPSSLVPVRTSC